MTKEPGGAAARPSRMDCGLDVRVHTSRIEKLEARHESNGIPFQLHSGKRAGANGAAAVGRAPSSPHRAPPTSSTCAPALSRLHSARAAAPRHGIGARLCHINQESISGVVSETHGPWSGSATPSLRWLGSKLGQHQCPFSRRWPPLRAWALLGRAPRARRTRPRGPGRAARARPCAPRRRGRPVSPRASC